LHFICASCYSFILHFLQIPITVLTSNPSHLLKDDVILSHFFYTSIYLRVLISVGVCPVWIS
jgi:hypothetical protein